MKSVDVIILSYCINKKIYEMNVNCLNSLLNSESDYNFNVLLIESNKKVLQSDWIYSQFPQVNLIIPQEPFNYNKFLNIGLTHSRNEFIAFCNNDLLFENGWFNSIHKAMEKTNGLSFCPINPYSNDAIKYKDGGIKKGYRVRNEFVGWCYVVKKELFNRIPLHDERFDFYFQDNDFAMTLRKYDIPHYLVPESHVVHLEGETSKVSDGFAYKIKEKNDREKFRKKWGSPRMIGFKNRIATYLMKPLYLNFLLKYFY